MGEATYINAKRSFGQALGLMHLQILTCTKQSAKPKKARDRHDFKKNNYINGSQDKFLCPH